ncbi:hypothetical protein [Haladaptatus sp. DYSN1]|uniref:DUF7546 family protein n=1 Tax=unclassified Haladaptatus TaxID=2622732 RepID=UPI0024074F2F|nr:hypothetical protein [Haladaptatus sp. DYSN1]
MTPTVAQARRALPMGVTFWAALFAIELLAVLAYLTLPTTTVSSYRYLVYPFLWINVGLWAVVHAKPIRPTRPVRILALCIAGVYFFVLAFLTGLVEIAALQVGHSHLPSGLQLTMSAPGFGPRVFYTAPWGHVSFIPYRVIGYLALAYLFYVTLLDATRAAVSAVFGLVSCLACSFPLLATLVAGVGGSAGLLASASIYSLDISTAAFLVAATLLYWRPGRA